MGKKTLESKDDLNQQSSTRKSNKQKSPSPNDEKRQDDVTCKCDSVRDPKTEELITKQATSALLYLLFYSILMFTLPFGAFFGTRHILREHSDFSEFTITSLSVASSVITVYIIIALYAIKAYTEKDVIVTKKCKNCNKME